MKKIITLVVISLLTTTYVLAKNNNKLSDRINVVFGIGQLTQGGFNVEGNLFYKRLVFDYSHGISLGLNNTQLENGADKDQGLSFQLPWTTGFGVGYRFTDWLNLRVEPKWHKFEVVENLQTADNLVGDYTTFTLGLGLYAHWLPFKKQDNLLKGIMIVPNIRWWPRISSTLENNELSYFNSKTEQIEVHQAREIGVQNTPFFYNLSIGYSFTF